MEKIKHQALVEKASAKKRLQIILDMQLNSVPELKKLGIWSENTDLHEVYENLEQILDKIMRLEISILNSAQQS